MDLGLEGLASAPEDEGKESEKKNKQHKQKQINPNLPIPFGIPIIFFLFFLLLFLLVILRPVKLPPRRQVPVPIHVVLKRRRESRRRRLTRMVDWRRMVKMVRRRTHRTRPVRHFLHVLVRRALHVVQRPPRRSRRRRLVHAGHLWVRFRVHPDEEEEEERLTQSQKWNRSLKEEKRGFYLFIYLLFFFGLCEGSSRAFGDAWRKWRVGMFFHGSARMLKRRRVPWFWCAPHISLLILQLKLSNSAFCHPLGLSRHGFTNLGIKISIELIYYISINQHEYT